jgi:4-hydroxy 2-oxovalerate aldolase
VVFYKHQIEEAILLCKAVRDNGYKLFVQPMVTIDYTLEEYSRLIRRMIVLQPYAISIVDSFGYMNKDDFRKYFKVLDNVLDSDVVVGFHSHNNMNLAFITAQDILEYKTNRRIIVDASLYGMGRGAGNLNTELIAHYYNMIFGEKYDIQKIMHLISAYIMPITKEKQWGYSPYLFLTGLYHCHPNYACYLLEEYQVTVEEFEKFLLEIPADMKIKCRKPKVLEMWNSSHPSNL